MSFESWNRTLVYEEPEEMSDASDDVPSILVEPYRRALLIGVNYSQHPDGFLLEATGKTYTALNGSHTDVDALKACLIDFRGWREDEFIILKDDPTADLDHQPTRSNIMREMATLAEESRPGMQLFLQFSGHGGQIKDLDDDEIDGLDEIIITSEGNMITDDEMHEILIRKIPEGCKMTALFDCCSSGTALDLPIFPDTSIFINSPVEVCESPLSASSYVSRGTAEHLSIDSLVLQPSLQPKTEGFRPAVRRKYSSGDVMMWSSCSDGQSSGEVRMLQSGVSCGAMTHAFIESIVSEEFRMFPTYHTLLENIRKRVKMYGLPAPQNVQFSSSREMSMDNWIDI